ncbi:MAG: hypothetical protein ABJE95_34005 [Byssovorax sp.]
MRRRPLLSLALSAALALLATSCLSPTLPLPPPDVESVQSMDQRQWTVAGSCTPGAIVSVFDVTQNKGVLVEDVDLSGKFVVTLTATLCDQAWVSQVIGTETSAETPFVIEPHSPNDTSASSACH